MKHLTWVAVFASALAVAEPSTESAPGAAADVPVVDMAVLELESGERADPTLGAPLKRVTEELDRALELQLPPRDGRAESESDYVAWLR